MARLRAPDGCPWDREQTHESLLKYLLEESTEFIEATQERDTAHMCEELGDVLLQIVFHAQVASEAGNFGIHEVIDGISSKLVRRHPHVFGETTADTPDAVTAQWDQIKLAEKAAKGIVEKPKSVLDKVSRALPPLMRAQELQAKAAKVNFDWADVRGVLAKVREEVDELEVEQKAGDKARFEDEFGDLLFALVNLARHSGIEAEQAMVRANAKFERRFRKVEERAGGGDAMKAMSLAQLDMSWDDVKREEKST